MHDTVVLSAGYDGQICIYNTTSGHCLRKFQIKFQPTTEPVFTPLDCLDCRFSPDGMYIAATDVWGHASLFGFDEPSLLKSGPAQQFFHTDYDPVVTTDGGVLVDSQRQIAPNLVHPQILVSIEALPYLSERQSTLTTEQRLSMSSLQEELISLQQQQKQLTNDELVALQSIRVTAAVVEDLTEDSNKDRKIKGKLKKTKAPKPAVTEPLNKNYYDFPSDNSDNDPNFDPEIVAETGIIDTFEELYSLSERSVLCHY